MRILAKLGPYFELNQIDYTLSHTITKEIDMYVCLLLLHFELLAEPRHRHDPDPEEKLELTIRKVPSFLSDLELYLDSLDFGLEH